MRPRLSFEFPGESPTEVLEAIANATPAPTTECPDGPNACGSLTRHRPFKRALSAEPAQPACLNARQFLAKRVPGGTSRAPDGGLCAPDG